MVERRRDISEDGDEEVSFAAEAEERQNRRQREEETTVYRHIIVPLDGSLLAQRALPLAATLASRSGAVLRLVHVRTGVLLPTAFGRRSPGDTPVNAWEREARDREQRYLGRMAERVRERYPGTTVRVEVLEGPIAPALLAASRRADLVVMATHGLGAFGRAWLGSVADRVVREAAAPVILIRPEADPVDLQEEVAIERILVALDGSPAAEQVLPSAVALATVIGGEITLLHVLTPLAEVGPKEFPLGAYLEPARLKPDEAMRYLQAVAEKISSELTHVNTVIYNHPRSGEGILTAAVDVGAHLLALTTRGHGGVKRLLLGSVADKVIRTADLPVLVVAPPAARRGRLSRRVEAGRANSELVVTDASG